MAQTILYSATMEAIECGVCGLPFALPVNHLRMLRETGKGFRCPSGCGISYGQTEADRLKRRAETAERVAANAREDARAEYAARKMAERKAAAYKGVATRTKRRAAHGVCPVPGCKRSFANVERHVSSQHPDYTAAPVTAS